MRVSALASFILERHRIYLLRAKGRPAPWTKDRILQQYRFCNVYRELDRVTQWITTHWREPHATHPQLWFAMIVARLINHPPTLALFALPGRWNKTQFVSVMAGRKRRGEKAFGSAYIVSTNGKAMDKAVYLADEVLDPLWNKRDELRPTSGDTLTEYCATLRQHRGMGSFIAAQVIADLKYAPPLQHATDWWTFASSGPGSRRGLNRVIGRATKIHWQEPEWLMALRELRHEINPLITNAGLPKLHAQDLQNCLCEFDKYERTRLGEGRPKQNFIPNDNLTLEL